MQEEYPADRYIMSAMGPIEWRRDITDPDVLFERDERIVESSHVQPADEQVIGYAPVARGMNWNELTQGVSNGEHRLRAVVNVESQNLGLVDTIIDDKPVTYITRMATNKEEKSELLAILDTPAEGDVTFSLVGDRSDRWEGFEKGVVTVKRSADGTLSVINESLSEMRVGTGQEPKPERSFRERFSLRSVYRGLKRAIKGEPRQAGPTKYEAFVGTTNWMVSDVVAEYNVGQFTRYMRQNEYQWYAAQPV
jgi:hypothetical protein